MALDADGYPLLADLLSASSSAELAAATAAEQAGYRSAAIRMVESYAGQRFAAEGESGSPISKLVGGQGRDRLMLPRRLAELASLSIATSAITEDDVAIGSSRDLVDGMNDYLYVRPDATIGSWVTRALIDDRRRIFPEGEANVTVEGVWGWPDGEFPSAVEEAIRVDMEDQAAADAHGLGSTLVAALAFDAWREGSDTGDGGEIDVWNGVCEQRAAADVVGKRNRILLTPDGLRLRIEDAVEHADLGYVELRMLDPRAHG